VKWESSQSLIVDLLEIFLYKILGLNNSIGKWQMQLWSYRWLLMLYCITLHAKYIQLSNISMYLSEKDRWAYELNFVFSLYASILKTWNKRFVVHGHFIKLEQHCLSYKIFMHTTEGDSYLLMMKAQWWRGTVHWSTWTVARCFLTTPWWWMDHGGDETTTMMRRTELKGWHKQQR